MFGAWGLQIWPLPGAGTVAGPFGVKRPFVKAKVTLGPCTRLRLGHDVAGIGSLFRSGRPFEEGEGDGIEDGCSCPLRWAGDGKDDGFGGLEAAFRGRWCGAFEGVEVLELIVRNLHAAWVLPARGRMG